MKPQNINNSMILVMAVCLIQACAAGRYNAGSTSTVSSVPGGPVTPATGSASNIASGRNTTGTPITSGEAGIITDRTNNTAGSGDAGMSGTVTSGSAERPVSPDAPAVQDDSPFITEAALNGIAEAGFSELAVEKSQNPDIKAFAVMMVQEHGKANAELKSLAESKNVTLPDLNIADTTADKVNQGQNNGSKRIETAGDAAPGTVMDINQKMKKLKASAGNAFDQQYIDIMVQDHKKAITLFEQGTKSADPQVKAYATKYLPVLKMHLQSINALNTK